MNFIPGLELNRGYYFDVVAPILAQHFPGLVHSAALVGYGSDVAGFDTPTSMDHNWGPRCQIFIDERDSPRRDEIRTCLSLNLPVSYRGFPTNFTDPQYDHTQRMAPVAKPPVRHLIEVVTLSDYLSYYLKTPKTGGYTTSEWLGFPDQCLVELTAGEVFHDGLGLLVPLRSELAHYPLDVLKLKLAALWNCVWNEEPFVGRCIETGDRIGLRLIQSRMVGYLLKIAFLVVGFHVPYSKWFGLSLHRLPSGGVLSAAAMDALYASDPGEMQASLSRLAERVVDLHNACGSLPHLENRTTTFFGRPYAVIFAESIVTALIDSLDDPGLKTLSLNTIALDLKVDSADFTG